MTGNREWKNFSPREFTRVKVGNRRYRITLDEVGYFLLGHLVSEILQPIRDHFRRPVIVTCGARDWQTHMAIRAEAEKDPTRPKPSQRSDHFFANSIYPYGVGAADIALAGVDPVAIVRFAIENNLPTGQAIAYPARGFAHISNPRELLFSEVAIETVLPPKAPYLVWSSQNGYRRIE